MYTLGDAAKATGMSKAALSKAIQKGRISAVKDDGGRFQIDPAELHRVYPPANTKTPTSEQERTQETLNENTELRGKVAALGELLEQIKGERDDLREDRDKWREQASLALLTHQTQPQQAANQKPRRAFKGWALTGLVVLLLVAAILGASTLWLLWKPPG